jgi:phosphate acetyltransferase
MFVDTTQAQPPGKYDLLIAAAKAMPPVSTIVVHPCDDISLRGAVETITTRIPSTIEAAALCKMTNRGQITGGVIDGPLAFDNAIDVEAAQIKGIKSEVAGRAQILVVSDLEASNMWAKNLAYFAKADGAGIVLGARLPIVLTSRADSPRTRMASCAIAALYANARRQKAPTIAA